MKRGTEEVLTELLVLRTQDGEPSAWRRLVSLWQKSLYRQARHLTGRHDVANDITQESWMAILRSIHRLEDPARFRAWAFRIVRNKANDWARRQSRQRRLLETAREAAEREHIAQDDVAGNRGATNQVHRLRDAIRELPPDRRELISMFYVDGMSLSEIADTLQIPVGTVKSRLHSIRQELKSLIERSHS